MGAHAAFWHRGYTIPLMIKVCFSRRRYFQRAMPRIRGEQCLYGHIEKVSISYHESHFIHCQSIVCPVPVSKAIHHVQCHGAHSSFSFSSSRKPQSRPSSPSQSNLMHLIEHTHLLQNHHNDNHDHDRHRQPDPKRPADHRILAFVLILRAREPVVPVLSLVSISLIIVNFLFFLLSFFLSLLFYLSFFLSSLLRLFFLARFSSCPRTVDVKKTLQHSRLFLLALSARSFQIHVILVNGDTEAFPESRILYSAHC